MNEKVKKEKKVKEVKISNGIYKENQVATGRDAL